MQIIIKVNYCFQRKKIFKNIYNKRLDRIEELTKKINYDDLNFIVESCGDETNFIDLEDPIVFLSDIKTVTLKLEEAKNLPKDVNKLLKKFGKEIKLRNQKKLANINMLINERNDSIKFVEDYGSMILGVKRKQLKKNSLKY